MRAASVAAKRGHVFVWRHSQRNHEVLTLSP